VLAIFESAGSKIHQPIKHPQAKMMINAFSHMSVAAAAAARRHRSINFISPLMGRSPSAMLMSSGLSEEEKHERFLLMEHENWEEGFEAYDNGFGPLTQQTIPTLLSKAGFPPSKDDKRGYPYALLDVATGPGFVLTAALDQALKSPREFDVQFTGLDITQNFLSLAKQRVEVQLSQHKVGSNQINVQFIVGNAEKLSMKFPKNTFDSIVCNFGILHFFSPDDFLSEAYRVLRPGGKVSFSAWAPPSRTEGFGITLQSVAEVGNPNVDLPEGPDFFRFGNADEAMMTMQTLGFENVESVESEMKWNNVKDGQMLYDVLSNGTVRTKELLRRQSAEQTEAIKSLVAKKYNELTNGATRPLNMPAVVTSGQKPNSHSK
jgi:SAM-dependent methyltransferase